MFLTQRPANFSVTPCAVQQILGAYKWLMLCVLVLFTSACATVNKRNSVSLSVQQAQANQEALQSLQDWQLNGRIAIISPSQRQSAYVNWQQAADTFEFNLSNLLGISVLQLAYDGSEARLETDGKEFIGTSPSALVAQASGWELPMQTLPLWIKAQQQAQDSVIYSNQGLLESLKSECSRCEGWQVNYSDYKKVQAYWLPHRVNLVNQDNQTTVKFKISQWQIK